MFAIGATIGSASIRSIYSQEHLPKMSLTVTQKEEAMGPVEKRMATTPSQNQPFEATDIHPDSSHGPDLAEALTVYQSSLNHKSLK
jgi:hypothetical protein